MNMLPPTPAEQRHLQERMPTLFAVLRALNTEERDPWAPAITAQIYSRQVPRVDAQALHAHIEMVTDAGEKKRVNFEMRFTGDNSEQYWKKLETEILLTLVVGGIAHHYEIAAQLAAVPFTVEQAADTAKTGRGGRQPRPCLVTGLPSKTPGTARNAPDGRTFFAGGEPGLPLICSCGAELDRSANPQQCACGRETN